MHEEPLFLVKVDEIIRSKIQGKAKYIPKFLTHWLACLIRQDGLNDFLRYNSDATGVEFMQNAVRYFDINLTIVGEENIPQMDEKLIFASNHPLGGLDGICLSAILGERYHHGIKYLVNDILYFIKPLQSIFVPINKHGTQAKSSAYMLNEAFASESQVITFPAGLCSRKKKGLISDSEWKKMFIIKAVEYKRNIVPVYFKAHNSAFFYRLANIRKTLGMQFNLEMLLLPNEMFKAKGATFSIYFGKPIVWQTFDSSRSPQQWANQVRKEVYRLGGIDENNE